MSMAADAVQLAAAVRRLVAPNPSLMTGAGTNTYLLGTGEVAVLDPGPAIAEHIDRIVAEAPGRVRWILVTHTHPDHSPGAAALAAKTGAELLGLPPPPGEHQDTTFVTNSPQVSLATAPPRTWPDVPSTLKLELKNS